MAERIKLGLYMYTPAIGGAEQYFRDLIWHLDPHRYTITVFHEPWPPFGDFLGNGRRAGVNFIPVNILESDSQLRVCLRQIHDLAVSVSSDRNLLLRTKRNLLRGLSLFSEAMFKYLNARFNYRILTEALRSVPLDILHISNGGYPAAWTARLAALAAKAAGVPRCVMTINNTPTHPQPITKYLDKHVFDATDCFIAVSHSVRERFLRNFKVQKEKVCSIHYGVELPSVADSSRMRELLGVPVNTFVITVPARLAPEKGHQVLLDALLKARSQLVSRAVVIIMGDGPLRASLEKTVASTGLREIVKFTGHFSREEALAAIAASDAVLLSSLTEGLPYAITEAMALYKPVIATTVGGIPEQVVHARTGVLVQPDSPEELAAAILDLVNDQPKAVRFGIEGHERYCRLFTLSRMLREHDELYTRLTVKSDES